MLAGLKGALWFLALFLELPQKESPAFDVFVPCLLRLRVLRVPFVQKGEFFPPFGIEWKSSVTLVTSMDSWSHFHVKPSVFPLSNMVNLPRRCQSCLGQEK